MIKKAFILMVFSLFFLSYSYLMAQYIIVAEMDMADGEGNFAEVEPGDTVYIASGARGALIIRNFKSTPAKPIIFVPDHEGEVLISGDLSYGISIRNCSNIRLSGFKGSHTEYGIKITDLYQTSSVGVSMTERSTDVEIDHIEISNIGFAGILAKTEPKCGDAGSQRGGFVQKNTNIHHCHIYDTGGEGLYIGSTGFSGLETNDCGIIYPPVLEGVSVHDNLLERTKWDAIQISSAITDCQIYNNRIIDCSTALIENQMSGILIGGGTKADCYNNWIEDCYGTGILVFGFGGTRVFNNVIIRPAQRYYPDDPEKRDHGIYLNDKTGVNKTFYGVYSNTIIQPKSDCIRISANIDFEVRIYNNILVDPGAYEVYENDNTDRKGSDAYIFLENGGQKVRLAANATIGSIVLPRFANPDEDDYHLNENSPYVDAGRDLTDQNGVNFDFDGKSRPQGANYDIGAFEYGTADGISNYSSGLIYEKIIVNNFGSGDYIIKLHNISTEVMQISLFNSTGQVIDNYPAQTYPPGDYSFNFFHLPDGIYFFTVTGSGWRRSKKLLVY